MHTPLPSCQILYLLSELAFSKKLYKLQFLFDADYVGGIRQ